MPFRKSSKYRYSRGKIPARKIPKSIARVRKQRIVSFNTMQACEHTCVPVETSNCTTNFTIALLRNVDLQQLFGDNVKIVSMRGNIFIDPMFHLPYAVDSNCVTGLLGDPASWLGFMNSQARSIWQFRAGMIKSYSELNFPNDPQPNYQVENSFDWSEPSYLKRWEHLWFHREDLGIDHIMQNAIQGICANVSKPDTGAILNPLAGGTGNINTQTGAISTVCGAVGEPLNTGMPQRAYRQIRQKAPYRMSVSSRRVITLKENENLEIQCAFSTLFPGTDCFPTEEDTCMLDCEGYPPCIIRIIPNVLMTLQYG